METMTYHLLRLLLNVRGKERGNGEVRDEQSLIPDRTGPRVSSAIGRFQSWYPPLI